MTGTRGLEFLLDLEHAIALRGGDALVLEDGRLIEVVAAPEPLVEIRGADPLHLVRVAWHLGNRHLPTQIMPKGPAHPPRSRHRGHGERGWVARIIEIEAPFDPEGGAYAALHAHAPDQAPHGHGGHDHSAHDHGHRIKMMTTVTAVNTVISMTTIIMTSIATTIITITITPMLMTTSEPAPADERAAG